MIERVYAERFCQSTTDSNFANACIKVCILQFDSVLYHYSNWFQNGNNFVSQKEGINGCKPLMLP
ncbi:MAG: hypothetical protein JEZ01_18845 [Labilibaculum sp.]|nr:hypothetical protein [Labilibaculum sp.]